MVIPLKAKMLGETYGADFEVVGGRRAEVTAWSPVGSVWKATSAHVICGRGAASVVWPDVVERMAEGIEFCTDAACDTCHPEGEPAPRHLRIVK